MKNVSVPIAKSLKTLTGSPTMNYSGNGTDGRVRIRHREYIGEVTGNIAFGGNSYLINPGNTTMFPWLSGIARLYEKYKFNKLQFLVETEASTTTGGSVMMAVDYEVVDTVPTTKTVLMSFLGAVRSAIWDACVFACDANDRTGFARELFIRLFNNTPATTGDARVTDLGQLMVATSGLPANSTLVGELYVEYDVDLITPSAINANFVEPDFPVQGYRSTSLGSHGSQYFANGYADSSGTHMWEYDRADNKMICRRDGEYFFSWVYDILIGADYTYSYPSGTCTFADAGHEYGSNSYKLENYKVTATAGQYLVFNSSADLALGDSITLRIVPFPYAFGDSSPREGLSREIAPPPSDVDSTDYQVSVDAIALQTCAQSVKPPIVLAAGIRGKPRVPRPIDGKF